MGKRNGRRSTGRTAEGDGDDAAGVREALAHHQTGRLAEAEHLYRRVLEADPRNADALHLLGVVALQTGRPEEAVELIGKAAKRRKKNPQFLNNLGEAYRALGRLAEAAKCYRRAIALDRRDPGPHNNLGNVLAAEGRPAEAAASYRRALKLQPNDPEVLVNLGDVLKDQGEAREAMMCFERALAINPGDAVTLCRLGDLHRQERRLKQAVAHYRRAAEIDPVGSGAFNNLGGALAEDGDQTAAIAAFQRAIEANPRDAVAHNNLAILLFRQARLDEAITHHRRALEIDPGFATAAGDLLYSLLQACAWDDSERLKADAIRRSATRVEADGRSFLDPFLSVLIDDDPARNLAVARSWSREITSRMSRLKVSLPMIDRRRPKDRLTIGYLTRDIYNHATAHLTRTMFGLHDRHKVVVHVYSYGPDDDGSYARDIKRGCDRFVDIRETSFAAAARRIHDDEVDILVDLKGYTRDSRLEICALRPAPVQATYLGFPGTIGADFIDYNIVDGIVVPKRHARHYSEACVRMPHAYQVNDFSQRITEHPTTRGDWGLPAEALVLCSFNNSNKLEPVMFGAWMDILRRLPESVLWLLESNAAAVKNLKARAKTAGIDPRRLIFSGKVSKADHLARVGHADLALDTLIYNGHTTTSDMLWAGVPVVAVEGRHFASRVSASLLTAVGMPELITRGVDDYRDLVLRLAGDRPALKALRRRLVDNRSTAPLFDTPRFVRQLEWAYARMWENWVAGNKPEALDVPDEA